MIKSNPRFHNYSLDDLFRYAVLCDQNAYACWIRFKHRKMEYFKHVGQFYRAEYWAAIEELAYRYNPIFNRSYLDFSEEV